MESRLAFYDTESPVETGTSPEHYYFKSNSEYLSKYYPEKISLYEMHPPIVSVFFMASITASRMAVIDAR